MMFLLTHNSVIDHSGVSMHQGLILNEATIRAATGIANSAIFSQEYIMKLNGSFAVTMLQTEFMNDYVDCDSDACIFMSALLFQLTCGFCNTS